MKVGILTLLYKNHNYGGALQAYALNKYLEKRGNDVKDILFDATTTKTKNSIRSVYQYYGISEVFGRIRNKIATKLWVGKRDRQIANEYQKEFQSKKEKYDSWLKQMECTKVYQGDNIGQTNELFDVFVVGSDQVWNPMWNWKEEFYLTFAGENKKKIAYAVSVGTDTIPNGMHSEFQNRINRFDKISVRELQTKDLVESFYKKDVQVMPDPTFLLKKEEWEGAQQPVEVGEPYIFCYFLGKSQKVYQYAEKIAKACGLKLVYLPFAKSGRYDKELGFGDIKIYDAGPGEFLHLINHAELVLTDSFHACVFSIVFGKKFWVVNRMSDSGKAIMGNRIVSLLKTFNLNERLLQIGEERNYMEALDYSDRDGVVDKMRMSADRFFDEVENSYDTDR